METFDRGFVLRYQDVLLWAVEGLVVMPLFRPVDRCRRA